MVLTFRTESPFTTRPPPPPLFEPGPGPAWFRVVTLVLLAGLIAWAAVLTHRVASRPPPPPPDPAVEARLAELSHDNGLLRAELGRQDAEMVRLRAEHAVLRQDARAAALRPATAPAVPEAEPAVEDERAEEARMAAIDEAVTRLAQQAAEEAEIARQQRIELEIRLERLEARGVGAPQ